MSLGILLSATPVWFASLSLASRHTSSLSTAWACSSALWGSHTSTAPGDTLTILQPICSLSSNGLHITSPHAGAADSESWPHTVQQTHSHKSRTCSRATMSLCQHPDCRKSDSCNIQPAASSAFACSLASASCLAVSCAAQLARESSSPPSPPAPASSPSSFLTSRLMAAARRALDRTSCSQRYQRSDGCAVLSQPHSNGAAGQQLCLVPLAAKPNSGSHSGQQPNAPA